MKRNREEGCSECQNSYFATCIYCKTDYCRNHTLNWMVCGIQGFLSSEYLICKSCLLGMRNQINRDLELLDKIELENLTEKLEELKR